MTADKEKHYKFRSEIQQMMYVSGETADVSVETTGMVEEIVQQQVVEILRLCTDLAARRGTRTVSAHDIVFLIRHDTPKVSRLRQFLSWKDVRKNAKESDEKNGDPADPDLAVDDAVGVPGAAPGVPGGPGAGAPGIDPFAVRRNRKAKVQLPWEPASFFSQEVPERDGDDDANNAGGANGEDEEEEMNAVTLKRLQKADERTKAMTREEYVRWADYRQASFTYRKGKKFREWAGFGTVTDAKPGDDFVDILGFLLFEMVQTITEEALKVKEQEDLYKERSCSTDKSNKRAGLFDLPSEERSPVEPKHIQEAFRRLQSRPVGARAMLNGSRLRPQYGLKLI